MELLLKFTDIIFLRLTETYTSALKKRKREEAMNYIRELPKFMQTPVLKLVACQNLPVVNNIIQCRPDHKFHWIILN